MTPARARPAPRPPRADARRNRARIITVARTLFTTAGAHASLDEIARRAKVGPGTLYRHFPTREALLEAVYRGEVDALAASPRQLAHLPPIEALRAWLHQFVDAFATKQIILPALAAAPGHPASAHAGAYTPIYDAVRTLARRAVRSGDLRRDLDPADILRAIMAVANASQVAAWRSRALTLVEILLAGARPGRR